MEKITAYKTKDGNVFDDEKEAKAHEKYLIRKEKIEKFVDDHCYSGMSKGDIVSIIIEYQEELRKIFA